MNTLRSWFHLGRHDIRSSLPAALQPIVQNGLLYRTFEDALVPDFLFPMVADSRPWAGGLGDTTTFTKPGLFSPVTTPLTVGNDPGASTYSVEQYSATMNQYAGSTDTNLLQSAIALQSKFIEDNQLLATQAGQSLNRIARNKLYAAYTGGQSWVTTAQGTASTTCVVNDATGFSTVLVDGVPTAVSGTNPLNVTVAGAANTVVAVNLGTNTVTLGTAKTQAVGDSVLATNAPVVVRTGGAVSRFALAAGNVATLKLFRTAVARLRAMAVPTIGGYYVAHIDAATESQLFDDADFKQALQGRVDSPIFRDLSIGRFSGIDWVRNLEAPTKSDGTSTQNKLIHQPIVLGGGALIAAPFADMGSLLSQVEGQHGAIQLISPASGAQVAHIIRPPQDKLQQVVSSSWSYVGDYSVPSDSGTGDAALYKRAVVVEHTDS